jgi:predicted nucleotidyltransferase
MDDGLQNRHRETILSVLRDCPQIDSVVLFGSRATGTFSESSDVDLALFGYSLGLAELSALGRKLDETSVPYRVDLLAWATLDNPALRDHIQTCGVPWM